MAQLTKEEFEVKNKEYENWLEKYKMHPFTTKVDSNALYKFFLKATEKQKNKLLETLSKLDVEGYNNSLLEKIKEGTEPKYLGSSKLKDLSNMINNQKSDIFQDLRNELYPIVTSIEDQYIYTMESEQSKLENLKKFAEEKWQVSEKGDLKNLDIISFINYANNKIVTEKLSEVFDFNEQNKKVEELDLRDIDYIVNQVNKDSNIISEWKNIIIDSTKDIIKEVRPESPKLEYNKYEWHVSNKDYLHVNDIKYLFDTNQGSYLKEFFSDFPPEILSKIDFNKIEDNQIKEFTSFINNQEEKVKQGVLQKTIDSYIKNIKYQAQNHEIKPDIEYVSIKDINSFLLKVPDAIEMLEDFGVKSQTLNMLDQQNPINSDFVYRENIRKEISNILWSKVQKQHSVGIKVIDIPKEQQSNEFKSFIKDFKSQLKDTIMEYHQDHDISKGIRR